MTTPTNFTYEAFDRQMENLLDMGAAFMQGYGDYDFSEQVGDIRSLHTKVSRLCKLTEQDLALQQEDQTHSRQAKNEAYAARLKALHDRMSSYPEITNYEHAADFMQLFSMIDFLQFHFEQMTKKATGSMSTEEESQAMQRYERQLHPKHPESGEATIFNKVFRTNVGGKPVDMKELREKIGQMIDLASRKNHWFCIYSVLKFRNFIKDGAAKYFSDQMRHPDWFPNLEKNLQFNGDTLTEYNGYLSETPFPAWNQTDFDRYCTQHHKTRWAHDLWHKFQELCYQMNDVFK